MGTKSSRSSGTQHNARGVTQGNTLVDPVSGLPISVIEDSNGKKRLAVDANITADLGDLDVSLDGTGPDGDSVYIVDNSSGNKLKVEPDGSINSNVEIDASDGDNIAIKDSDGDELDIKPDGSVDVNVKGLTAPTIANILVPTANTELFYTFPSDTKKFNLRARGNAKLQICFVSGQTGTNFRTVFPGSIYEEIGLTISAITIYFESNKANEVVEITSWV